MFHVSNKFVTSLNDLLWVWFTLDSRLEQLIDYLFCNAS